VVVGCVTSSSRTRLWYLCQRMDVRYCGEGIEVGRRGLMILPRSPCREFAFSINCKVGALADHRPPWSLIDEPHDHVIHEVKTYP